MDQTIHYQAYLAKHARKNSTPLVCIAGLVRVTILRVLYVEISSENYNLTMGHMQLMFLHNDHMYLD